MGLGGEERERREGRERREKGEIKERMGRGSGIGEKGEIKEGRCGGEKRGLGWEAERIERRREGEKREKKRKKRNKFTILHMEAINKQTNKGKKKT